MVEAGGFVGISFPFIAGILAGKMLLGAASVSAYALAGVGMSVAALMLAACGALARAPSPLQGAARPAAIILFFLLGLCCRATDKLGSITFPMPEIITGSADTLKRIIAGTPFPSGQTPGLITALLTGDRTMVRQETYDCFRDSGASHLLALSGLHMGIVCSIVSKGSSLLGHSHAAKAFRAVFTILFSGFYALMTGAGPSIVRAFLFIMFSEVCHLSAERRRDPARILLAALTLQLALSPSVIDSLGFQLSYLATAGIILLYPEMSGWFPPEDGPGILRKVWKGAAISISCQAFTFPLVWLHFQSFPKFFLITNMLAIPLTTILIGISLLTITLEAAGCCPGALIFVNDFLTNLLLFLLETIRGM